MELGGRPLSSILCSNPWAGPCKATDCLICTTGGKGKRPAPRDPSPAPSEGSNASERGGSTKLYCMECYDPNNIRLMNFHEDCFNRWHCLGPYACPPCTTE